MKNRTKGQSERPDLKPHGQRWPAQCPHTSEHVYTPWVYYNHLLQEKQALFFEPAAKKKPLLAPFHSERHIQTFFLPQPRNPTTGWLRKTEQKMTGDKLRGGKRFIFSLNQKAWELGSLRLYFSNKVGVSGPLLAKKGQVH